LQAAPMISIVDDDDEVREATADLISSWGYDSATFPTGEAFLESGQTSHTSCLITDLQMPGLNGLELQRLLRNEGHKIPIIFVTAFPTTGAREQAMRDGAVAFLSKPFEETTLMTAITAALARSTTQATQGC
jgi:FixJ family two-component response regulator